MRNNVTSCGRRLSQIFVFLCLTLSLVSAPVAQETKPADGPDAAAEKAAAEKVAAEKVAAEKAAAEKAAAEKAAAEKEAAAEAASLTLRSGMPPALTLDDAGRWLADPLRRDAALASLRTHGDQGLALLTRWWKQNRKDEVVNQLVASAALPFEGDARKLYEQMLKNGKGQVALATSLSLLEPASTSHPLLEMAVRKLKSDQARSIAVMTLGDRRVASSVPLFRTVVASGRPLTRAAAARALGKTGDRKHVKLLIGRLQSENRSATKSNRVSRASIHWAMGELGGFDVVAPLVASIHRPDDRDTVVAALVKVGSPAIDTLVLLLKGGQKEYLPGAVSALLELEQAAAPALVEILSGPASKVRAAARDLLIAIRADSTPGDIAHLLKTQEIRDPTDLLRVLVQYDDADVISLFKHALRSPSPEIRRATITLAGQVDLKELIPELVKFLEVESNAGVVLEAIDQLHKMAADEAAEVLADLTENDDAAIRRAAASVLADLGGIGQVVALSKVAQDAADSDVKRAARRALTRISGLDSQSMSVKEWSAWARKASGWVKGWGRTGAKVSMRKAVARDGEEIPYRVAGTSGPYVIVVHGGPDGDSRYLNPVFDDLAKGYRVVTYDLRGRDGTRKSLRWLSRYRPSLDVEDLEAIRRSLAAKKVIVVGHSFGSLIALAYAKTYPSHVRKLVMMNSGVPYWKSWPEWQDFRDRLPEPWRSDMDALAENAHLYPPRTVQRFMTDLALPGMVRDRKLLPILRDLIGVQGDAGPFIFRAWGEYDLRTILAEVRMPTLLIATEGDIFSEDHIKELRAIASKNPRLRVRVIQGATHFPFIEKRGATMGTLRGFFGG